MDNIQKKILIDVEDDDVLLEIISELKIYAKTLELETPKVYFSGEFDSHQSDFERMSNDLEVAVISTNRELAMVLLRLVRCTFTGLDHFGRTLSEYHEKEISIKEIFTYLSGLEPYTKGYPVQLEFTRTLMGCKDGKVFDVLITKRIDEIDIWTLPRIFGYYKENF